MTTPIELRTQADEIAAAGHAGWGNTMRDAAAEIERLTGAMGAALEVTFRAEASRDAAQADAKRLSIAIKVAIERLHSNPASYLTNSVADKLQMALGEQS